MCRPTRSSLSIFFSLEIRSVMPQRLSHTSSRKSSSRKSHVRKLAKLSGTWLSRGSYGLYFVVTGSTWLSRGLRPSPFSRKIINGRDLREGVTAGRDVHKSF